MALTQGRRGGSNMPLKPGSSRETISQNIREFRTGKTFAHTAAKFGKERARKQAIAVALSTARKSKRAMGGKPPNIGPQMNMENIAIRGSMYGMSRKGLINSSVPGRTDKLPMSVRSGSYVVPADIVSGMGQGNTMAGAQILQKMFSTGPYGLPLMKGARSGAPRRMAAMRFPSMPRQKQEGGGEEEGDGHVPIIAAGGEYIIDPEAVRHVGNGNITHGHKVLDQFVLRIRKDNIKTQQKLKPPKK